MRVLVAASAITFALLATSPALAQGLASDVSRAVALFEEGRRFRAAGDCTHAIPAFLESIKYNESIGARLNLGECYENDPLSAWREFKRAEKLAQVKSDDRITEAHTRAEALKPKLALVRVTLSGGQQAAELLVDGKSMSEMPWQTEAVALPPGDHTVQIISPKKKPWSRQTALTTGQTTDVSVELEDDSGAPASAATTTWSTQRTVGVAVGAAGLVASGVGIALGLVASSTLDDVKARCPMYPQCDQADATKIRSLQDSGEGSALGSTLAIGLGVAAIAAGVVLFLTAPRGDVSLRARVTARGFVFALPW